MTTGPHSARRRSSGPSRNLQADLNSRLWAGTVLGFPGAFPCLVRRQMDWPLSGDQCASGARCSPSPRSKWGHSSTLNPIRSLHCATGASGWLHSPHTDVGVCLCLCLCRTATITAALNYSDVPILWLMRLFLKSLNSSSSSRAVFKNSQSCLDSNTSLNI